MSSASASSPRPRSARPTTASTGSASWPISSRGPGDRLDPCRAAGARGRRRAVRLAVAHGARLQRRDGRRVPPGAPLLDPRRAAGLHPAREADLPALGDGDGALPAGRQPEDRAPPAGPAARNPFDGRRADRRGTAKGADFPLHIECLPGGLRVVCRRPGRDSPARRPLRGAVPPPDGAAAGCFPGAFAHRRFPGRTGPFASRNFWISGRILLFLSAKTSIHGGERQNGEGDVRAAGAKDCTKSPFRGSKRK